MAKRDKDSTAMDGSKNPDHGGSVMTMAAKLTGLLKEAVKTQVAQSAPAVRVEYPQEGEVLLHPCYTIRIGTISGANNVEVSIDQGDWRACREALGMWWYDWSDYSKGEHCLVARSRIGSDVAAVSVPRLFTTA